MAFFVFRTAQIERSGPQYVDDAKLAGHMFDVPYAKYPLPQDRKPANQSDHMQMADNLN
jgi:hypothetical protein